MLMAFRKLSLAFLCSEKPHITKTFCGSHQKRLKIGNFFLAFEFFPSESTLNTTPTSYEYFFTTAAEENYTIDSGEQNFRRNLTISLVFL